MKLANIQTASTADCGNFKPAFDMDPNYLTQFAKPNAENRCLKCKEPIADRFRWGLVHGEGYCSECGWPARAYHFLKNEAEEIRVVLILQYHPKYVTRWRGRRGK